jgi:hypothetical protein
MQIAKFVEYFDPGAVDSFNMALRDFYATFGQVLSPVLKVVTAALRLLSDQLMSSLATLVPAINALALKFLEAFNKSLPLIIAVFEWFAGKFTEAVGFVLESIDNIDVTINWFKMGIESSIKAVGQFIQGLLLAVSTISFAIGLITIIISPLTAIFYIIIGILGMVGASFVRLDKTAQNAADGFENMANDIKNLQDNIKKRPVQKGQSFGLAASRNVGFSSIGDVGKEATKRAYMSGAKNTQQAKQDQANDALINNLPLIVAGLMNNPKQAQQGMRNAAAAGAVPKPAQQAGGPPPVTVMNLAASFRKHFAT